jgi:Zinc binding domain
MKRASELPPLTPPFEGGGLLADHALNKAFIREPEFDGRAFCPRCGTLGAPVQHGPLDTHINESSRAKMGDSAWFCNFPRCEVAYFNLFEAVVLVEALKAPVYPKDLNAPICACFGFNYDDVEADVSDGVPTRIRELLDRSKSSEARCAALAADGRCCMSAVQELYLRLRAKEEAKG